MTHLPHRNPEQRPKLEHQAAVLQQREGTVTGGCGESEHDELKEGSFQ